LTPALIEKYEDRLDLGQLSLNPNIFKNNFGIINQEWRIA
jgi:hypothetical protein